MSLSSRRDGRGGAPIPAVRRARHGHTPHATQQPIGMQLVGLISDEELVARCDWQHPLLGRPDRAEATQNAFDDGLNLCAEGMAEQGRALIWLLGKAQQVSRDWEGAEGGGWTDRRRKLFLQRKRDESDQ